MTDRNWEDDFLDLRREPVVLDPHERYRLQQEAQAAADACDMANDYQQREDAERNRLIKIIQEGRAREANNTRAWDVRDIARAKEGSRENTPK